MTAHLPGTKTRAPRPCFRWFPPWIYGGVALFSLILTLAADNPAGTNLVARFQGDGAYLELPSHALQGAEFITVEGWFRWDRFAAFGPALSIGRPWQMIGLNNRGTEDTLQFFLYDRQRNAHIIAVPHILELRQWYHLAGVAGPQGMRLYLNGMLVGTNAFAQGAAHLPSDTTLLLGRSLWENTPDFVGAVDNLRIWRRALSAEEIDRLMREEVTPMNSHAGLALALSFDEGTILDHGATGSNQAIHGPVAFERHDLPKPELLPKPAILSGLIQDSTGNLLPQATLQFHLDDREWITHQADDRGAFQFIQFAPHTSADLAVTWNDLGVWRTNLSLIAGSNQFFSLTLAPARHISGRIMTLEKDPMRGIVVQALPARRNDPTKDRDPRILASVRTDELGRYEFINLKPGKYQVRCLAPGRMVQYRDPAHPPLPAGSAGQPLEVLPGEHLTNIDFHIAAIHQGHWRALNFMDGLPGNNVLAMAQDDEGHLWVGMEYSGLVRFDGEQWHPLTTEQGLPDNKINAILPTQEGGLWLGTTKGLAYFIDGHIRTYTVQDGLGHPYVEALVADGDGTLWIATRGGLSRLDQGRLTTLTTRDGLAGDHVTSLSLASGGALWIATASGVSKLQDGTLQNYTASDGLVENFIACVRVMQDGSVWFGGWNKGVSILASDRISGFTTAEGLVDNQVRSLLQTPDGTIWVGTVNGATRYRNGAVQNFQPIDGGVSSEVWTMHQTRDNLLWFGMRGGGLSVFDQSSLQQWSAQDGLVGDSVVSLSRAGDGALWIGTPDGVSRFDGEQFQNYSTRDGLAAGLVRRVAAGSSDQVWVGTSEGASLLRNGRFLPANAFPDLSGRNVRDIALGPGSEAWFASYPGGLFHYDGLQAQRYGEEAGSGGGFLTVVYREPDGSLWTAGRDLIHYKHGMVRQYEAQDGLNTAEILCLERDRQNRLWIGTKKGLLVMAENRIAAVPMDGSLKYNTVYDVHVTEDGLVWCGTAAGVSVFDGDTWSRLDSRDGLPGHHIRAIESDAQGNLWFGTDRGLLRYRPSRSRPTLRIESVLSGGRLVDKSAQPEFPLGTTLRFNLGSIDFRTHPDKRRYRYQIKRAAASNSPEPPAVPERSGAWQFLDRNNQLDWIAQDNGWHHLTVQAVDRDLNYSEPVLMWLRVVTPWYVNPWTLVPLVVAMFALLTGTIVSTWRYRVKRRESRLAHLRMLAHQAFSREVIQHQEDERKRIAAELHDSLGQSLLVMKNRAVIGLQKAHDREAQRQQLSEISDTASQAIAETRQIAFNLRPHQLDSLGLHKGIHAMASKVCQSAGLKLTAHLENVTNRIPPPMQIHLFRITQEALNNVVKHARAAHVQISLRASGDRVVLSVADDGCGMPASQIPSSASTPPGFGRGNLRERVHLLQGTLNIVSQPGGGTTVTVLIPTTTNQKS